MRRATGICAFALPVICAALVAAVTAFGSANDVTPLPESFCSAPFYGGSGKPNLLVVSDFPLQVVGTRQRAQSERMVAAIKFVFSQRRFKAGKYHVAYQSCNDSNPEIQQGDLAKCAANAKAYAGDASVVAEIGTWNSACSGFEIPITNRAARGPLAIVSPSNTSVGLTRAGPGTRPGEPGRYYPSHKRSFLRVIAPDDVQAAAEALLAKQLNAKRVFVLNDKESYGVTEATTFTRAARKLRLTLAGSTSWNPDASSFDGVAGAAKRARAAAVFLGGSDCPNCGALIKALRNKLGSKVALIAPDGFFPVSDVIEVAGQQAEGMYVSVPGTTTAKLGRAGRRIVGTIGPPLPGSGGPPFAAQAAAVILDAIAKSNGSPASVTSNLFRLKVRNGILGSFRFDKNGDTTTPSIIVYRVRNRKQVVDRVLVPPARLLHY